MRRLTHDTSARVTARTAVITFVSVLNTVDTIVHMCELASERGERVQGSTGSRTNPTIYGLIVNVHS